MTATSDERALRILVLYPEVMDVYADRGNLIALRARAAVHDVAIEVTNVGLGDPLPEDADLILIGGGQDAEQRRVAADLVARGPRLRSWVEEGTAVLAVCGGFQLFGHSYRTAEGEELPGIGIFDVTTVAPPQGWERCIGDVLAVAALEDVGELVGFENHGGRTYLGAQARPFARVLFGHGNNDDDSSEGAVYREAIGTYLHGPVLPKNLALTDRLIRAALRHRYGPEEALEALESDPWAQRAHATAAAAARLRGRPRA
ncbi:MAG: glutamine amidotransferase [Dehalococcoidia bacterium]|nr:glutamine amidotransferase [Dehalococcoidia bacterium]